MFFKSDFKTLVTCVAPLLIANMLKFSFWAMYLLDYCRSIRL